MARQPKDKAGTSITVLIWSATLLGLVFVLGAVGYVVTRPAVEAPAPIVEKDLPLAAVNNKEQPVSAIPLSPAAQSLQKPAAPPVAVVPKPQQAPAAAEAFPALIENLTAAKPEKPELLLNNLAGTLRVRIDNVASAGDRYPLEHTCYRLNRSPGIKWSGMPAGTQSLVAILERRQANKPPVWLWVVFDIDPAAGALASNIPKQAILPNGEKHARNLYNKAEYTGPCEPKGKVPYAMRLFALNKRLELEGGVKSDDLIRAMNGHIIDATEFEVVHYLKF
jgi:Raf kinase inhibitor-like YbhB/YbcL family protein